MTHRKISLIYYATLRDRFFLDGERDGGYRDSVRSQMSRDEIAYLDTGQHRARAGDDFCLLAHAVLTSRHLGPAVRLFRIDLSELVYLTWLSARRAPNGYRLRRAGGLGSLGVWLRRRADRRLGLGRHCLQCEFAPYRPANGGGHVGHGCCGLHLNCNLLCNAASA